MQTKNRDFISKLFDDIAPNYDFLNNIISFGHHLKIKKDIINNLNIPRKSIILDLCCGTGDITQILAPSSVIIFAQDFSSNMLDIAKKRLSGYSNVEFVRGDAHKLPFYDAFFDYTFISFGLRNLEDPEKALTEMARVTKNSGYVVVVDTGKVNNPIIEPFFKMYFHWIMPLVGQLFFNSLSYNPYRYLSDSSSVFYTQIEMKEKLLSLGFKDVKTVNYLFGSIACYIAKV